MRHVHQAQGEFNAAFSHCIPLVLAMQFKLQIYFLNNFCWQSKWFKREQREDW